MSRGNVTINFSYANLPTGRITATPKASFIDSAGKMVVANISYPSVPITAGAASIILPETELEGIAFRFAVESGSAAPYTFIQTFDAIIKNVTPQNGNAFFTQFFSPDSLDTSIFNIADILTKTPFLDRLATRIPGFNFKVYTAATQFSKNDFTFRGDRFYQWLKTTVGSNVDPLSTGNYTDPGNLRDGVINATASWQVSSGSLAGSGTSTANVDYDFGSFTALTTQPASRRNLAQLDALLRTELDLPDLSAYARKDAQNSFTQSQSFGAGATVSDIPSNDNSSAIANSRSVRGIVSNMGLGSLASKVSVVEERYNQGISASLNAGVNSRTLNTIVRNPNTDIVSVSGSAIVLKAGTYLAFCGAIANRANGSKLYLFNNSFNSGAGQNLSTSGLSSYTGSNLANSSSQNVEISLVDTFTLTAQSTITLRHSVEVGAADAGGIAANRSGFQEVFSRLILFRLD